MTTGLYGPRTSTDAARSNITGSRMQPYLGAVFESALSRTLQFHWSEISEYDISFIQTARTLAVVTWTDGCDTNISDRVTSETSMYSHLLVIGTSQTR
jgi:hypothetical protein